MDFLYEGLIQAWRLLISGDPETYSAVRATLVVSFWGLSAALLLGIPLGFALGFGRFRGRRALRVAVETLLSLPTVVIGLIVFALLSRRGPLGGLDLLFTLGGVSAGLALLGLPIVAAMTATAVEGLEARVADTLLTLGANRRQLALSSLYEARHPILLAGITAFGRIASEVGIAMMVGGNIKWHTRTITTAIALETGKGEFAQGVALGLVLLAIAFVVTLGAAWLKRRSGP
ncbi:MAG: ABC transporter permease [Desulfovibrionaceae bacterium]